ncbi:Aste57867_15815 [Aphanomyces stellatus]|uniref:Aste57867_15815 protein n=1 Tax=Aphanomyces stellatus TaxID=120398 RepID=A0A485L6Z0_9STRA|nr:hypothetical protein As57867_015759 [Aphanomyces stellatus]VFT92603.1 Aste57867_15815 [Aphanomyces stellatus]
MSSAFAKAKLVMSCSLAPYHIQDPKKGLEDQLNHMLMKYCEPVQGVLLAFNSLQVINPYGHIINETPYIHVRIAADALVFRPTPGMQLAASINKIGSNHIGLLLAGVFNVSIAAGEMPPGYVHNYHKEAWVGKDGTALAVEDQVHFKVLQVHVAHGVISIDGSMRNVKQEAVASVAVASPLKKAEKVVKRKHVAFEDDVEEEEEVQEAPKKVSKKTQKKFVENEVVKKAKKPTKADTPVKVEDVEDVVKPKKAKKQAKEIKVEPKFDPEDDDEIPVVKKVKKAKKQQK